MKTVQRVRFCVGKECKGSSIRTCLFLFCFVCLFVFSFVCLLCFIVGGFFDWLVSWLAGWLFACLGFFLGFF